MSATGTALMNKMRELRTRILKQDDLLTLALPYVEAAQDDEAYDAAGKARARALADRIRAAVIGGGE
jgi:hypothetical protein